MNCYLYLMIKGEDRMIYTDLTKVIEVLKLLTHEKEIPYMDYIKKLSTNPIAKKVKIADLMHNSDWNKD